MVFLGCWERDGTYKKCNGCNGLVSIFPRLLDISYQVCYLFDFDYGMVKGCMVPVFFLDS